MIADLHMHSVYSDGVLTPSQLADAAKEKGISLFSITDHDNMAAYPEGAEAARARGLKFVRGWEVSSYENSGKVHVLGYGCRGGKPYTDYLEKRCAKEEERMRALLALGNEFFGTDLTLGEVAQEHIGGTPLHVMHLVRALSKRLARPAGEIFREAFAFGKPVYVQQWGPTPAEAIDLIHADGGLAFLAHPGRIGLLSPAQYAILTAGGKAGDAMRMENLSRRAALVDKLVRHGLDGIECVYSKHSSQQRKFYKKYARERGLFISGGSDYHDEESFPVGYPVFDADEKLAEVLLSLDGSVK